MTLLIGIYDTFDKNCSDENYVEIVHPEKLFMEAESYSDLNMNCYTFY